MDREISDEELVDLVKTGREEVRQDSELTGLAQDQISADMGDLAQRIIFELGRG